MFCHCVILTEFKIGLPSGNIKHEEIRDSKYSIPR